MPSFTFIFPISNSSPHMPILAESLLSHSSGHDSGDVVQRSWGGRSRILLAGSILFPYQAENWSWSLHFPLFPVLLWTTGPTQLNRWCLCAVTGLYLQMLPTAQGCPLSRCLSVLSILLLSHCSPKPKPWPARVAWSRETSSISHRQCWSSLPPPTLRSCV